MMESWLSMMTQRNYLRFMNLFAPRVDINYPFMDFGYRGQPIECFRLSVPRIVDVRSFNT